MTDNTSSLSPLPPLSPRNWWQHIPVWVPVAIGLFTTLAGYAGGYVSTQVATQVIRAHVDWELQDHEKRIASLERVPEMLNRIDGRLYRIEGALGVKPPQP